MQFQKVAILGFIGAMLAASCVSPTGTNPSEESSSTVKRTATPGSTTKATTKPGGTTGSNTGGNNTGGDNTTGGDTTASGSATPTPTPTQTPNQAEESYFGKVVDAAGNPVSGALLEGFEANATAFAAVAKTINSGADGKFELKGENNAALNIRASSGGKKALKFNVTATSSKNLFTLNETGTISGKVSAEGISDLTGIEVVIPGTDYKGTTNQQGNYTITEVPAGTYSLKATRGTAASGNLSDVAVAAGQTNATANLTLSTVQPNVTAVSPLNGGKGLIVTLTGTNFGTDPSKVTVKFGGSTADSSDIVSVTDTQIKVKVPAAAQSGNVTVTINSVVGSGKAFSMLSGIYLSPNRTQMYKGDVIPFVVKGVVRGGGADEAAPTITKWQITNTSVINFVGGDPGTATSAQVSALASGTASLKVYSGDEYEQLDVTVDGSTVTVSTLAGSGSKGVSAGTGSAATFAGITGVTQAADGAFYVTDQDAAMGSWVRKVTTAGVVSNYAGGTSAAAGDGTGTNARFFYPRFLAAHGNTVYIADQTNCQIRKLDVTNGAVTTYAGVGQSNVQGDKASADDDNPLLAKFGFPAGIALDVSGATLNAMYVTEGGYGGVASKIRKIAADGKVTTLTLSGSMQVDDGPNNQATIPTNTLNQPNGIVYDPVRACLYVADTNNNYIKRIQPMTGATVIVAGQPNPQDKRGYEGSIDGDGTTRAQINNPAGLALDGAGNLYVSDGQGYIRKLTFDQQGKATVSTVAGAGLGQTPNFKDGKGSEALFNVPRGLWVNSAGTEIIVADYQNNRLRRIVLDNGAAGYRVHR